jgi:thiol-disulfide isomerase/thioredoxin
MNRIAILGITLLNFLLKVYHYGFWLINCHYIRKLRHLPYNFFSMRVLSTVLLLMICNCWSIAQTGYKIDFKIKGWKDTTVYLGYTFWDQTYIKDTAKVNSQGVFFFEGSKALPQGMYFLVLSQSKIFDFVIGSDQQFNMETSNEDYIRNMKLTGDEDNILFFENMTFNMERHKEAEPFIKVLQDSTLAKDDPLKKAAQESFSKVNEKVMAYQNQLISKYPTTLTARLLKSSKQIEIPDPPKKADGSIDSTFQLRYYRDHFFDNFDLADEAMLRLVKVTYKDKVKEYLERLFVPDPDTITRAIIKLADKAKKNQETYKYLVWNCLVNYQNPEIMGLDRVYVNLYDKYYASGEMNFWITDSVKKNLKDYAEKLRGSLVGDQGRNLQMQDQNLQPRAVYDIKKKYTFIFFFDPDCGHCRQETPKLVEFYNKNKTKFDLEIFAVSADTSMQKMKDFAKEFKTTWITVNGPRSYTGSYSNLYYAEQTPTLYILDSKKKIIAKKPPIEKLEDFLTNYEKFQKLKQAPAKGT